jgi:hypothetical protein
MSTSSVSKNKPRRAVTCFDPEDGGNMLLQNVSSNSTDHTTFTTSLVYEQCSCTSTPPYVFMA